MSQTKAVPFIPNNDVLPCQAADAEVFFDAAEAYGDDSLSKTIKLCGGTMRHINHFSRTWCNSRPVDPWAAENDTDTIKRLLAATARELRDDRN